MKTKRMGLGILARVIVAAVLGGGAEVTEITGLVGGEKLGLLEDQEVQEILEERYHLSLDFNRAGSIEMVQEETEGRDFLFPSNQTALEIYENVHGNPVQSEIVLNTPIVLYTRRAVAEALVDQGIARQEGGGIVREYEPANPVYRSGHYLGGLGAAPAVRYRGGGHHRSHPFQLRQYVCGPAGQYPLRRGGRRLQHRGNSAPAPVHFPEAGLYGILLGSV